MQFPEPNGAFYAVSSTLSPDLSTGAELLAHGLEHLLNNLLARRTLGYAHCCQV